MNTNELRRHIEQGAAAVRLKAVTNSVFSEHGADEEFGNLRRSLTLCIGARVMLTHNLCVSHGLVNGTSGFVEDVIVSQHNVPVAILVKVRRRTATQDGYSGPCFIRGELPDTDDAETAIVAIPRFGVEAWDRGMIHKRQQFPLMLAWAVTGVLLLLQKKCGSTPCR